MAEKAKPIQIRLPPEYVDVLDDKILHGVCTNRADCVRQIVIASIDRERRADAAAYDLAMQIEKGVVDDAIRRRMKDLLQDILTGAGRRE